MEPRRPGEGAAASLPLTRSLGLESRVRSMVAAAGCHDVAVKIRQGPIGTEILAEIESGGHDVLSSASIGGGRPGWLRAAARRSG